MKDDSVLRSLIHRAAIAGICLVAAAAAIVPASADKLIVFKNGKTIRARTVKEAKGWSRLEMEGGVLGVRSTQILRVEESAASTPGKAESFPNQASVGGGGAGSMSPSYNPPQDQQQPEEFQPPDQQQQPQAPGVVVAPGARPVIGGANRGVRRGVGAGVSGSRGVVGPRSNGGFRSQNTGQNSDDDE